MLTPSIGFSFSLYLLVGVAYFYWSEPYRPLSKAIFDAAYYRNKGLWIVMVLIALASWPICALHLAYRCFFPPKKDDQGVT
jgi:hypothetical protein